MKINIKKELEKIDKNDFLQVSNLVEKIINDIRDISFKYDMNNEIVFELAEDYMIDLINPNLLECDDDE